MKISYGKSIKASTDDASLAKLVDIVKSWLRQIDNYRNTGKKYPESVISDLEASMKSVLKKYDGVTASCGKKSVKAAESYGWVVEDSDAWEAYDFACDYLGKDWLDAEIIQGLSTSELAESLAFIFRNADFREWDAYKNGEDLDDIDSACGKKSIKSAMYLRSRKRNEPNESGLWEHTYDVNSNKLYMGCPGAYFIYRGDSDPWVEYEGYLYNAAFIDDMLWSYYNEICEEEGIPADDDGFMDWVTPEEVESVLYDMHPFAKVTFDKGDTHTAEGDKPGGAIEK